jgi:hypothetical protein
MEAANCSPGKAMPGVFVLLIDLDIIYYCYSSSSSSSSSSSKDKGIPCGPEVSRRFRLPDFMIFGT